MTTTSTPYRFTRQDCVCQVIERALPRYREQGYPVEAMDAEITYLADLPLARWRLVMPVQRPQHAPVHP